MQPSFVRKGRLCASLCALALCGSATTALASNGSAPIAIGGRAAGRGGADTAIADDTLSLHLNPAGLGNLPKLRFDVQDMVTYSRDRFVNALNDDQDESVSFLAPSFGIAIDPYWGEPSDVGIRIGLGFAGVHGSGGEKKYRSSIYPEGVIEETGFAQVRFGPAIAVAPFPELRVGLGIFYNYLSFRAQSATTDAGGSAKGTVRRFRNPDGTAVSPPDPVIVGGGPVTWNDLFSIGSSPDSNSAALYELDDGLSHGVSFNLGVQFDINDFVTVGVSYISPTFFFGNIEGKAKVDASKALAAIQADPDIQAIIGPVLDAYLPGGQNASFLAKYDYELEGFNSPQVISLGVAVFPTETVALALDVRWMNYSVAYNRLDAKLSKGDNANINEINGSDEVDSRVEPDWRDMYVIGLGGTVQATDELALRLGYNYSNNPYPEDNLSPGSTAFVEHHITIGASYRFTERFSGTIAIVHALQREITGDTPHRNTPEFNGAKYAADQTFFYFGFGVDL